MENEVYIVNTEYEDNTFEINGVFTSKEKANRFIHFMKLHLKQFPEKPIKETKINHFVVL